MRLALVAMFADDARESKIPVAQRHGHFLVGLAEGAGMRGFAGVLPEFPPAWTP